MKRENGLWVCGFRTNGDALPAAVRGALADAGVAAEVADPEPSQPGVVIFDAVSDDLCDFVRRAASSARVLMIAGARDGVATQAAWRLLDAGAADVLAWSGHAAQSAAAVAARFQRWRDIDALVDSALVRDNLIGRSAAWIAVLRRVVEAARFTDAPAVITGESGTGKELIARLMHSLDPRARKRELIVVDCTTIVPELAGSEFFGHERGAFTGAVTAREGAFALADGGTLFLDEVGELPGALQAQLLRVVQEGTYKLVGGNTWQRTNFRLVCATNRDLGRAVADGRFRADLYHRLAGFVARLPPLRERLEDVIPLARHFLAENRLRRGAFDVDDALRQYLLQRAYPGNVRELKHLVLRIGRRHVGPGPFSVGDLPEDERPRSADDLGTWHDESFERTIRRAVGMGAGLKEIGSAAAQTAIRVALEDAEGNLRRAARALGVTERALQMRRATSRTREMPPVAVVRGRLD